MELRHLRYFVAAAEAGNLHQAAQRLHIVQPSLSRQIQALEQELQAQLLERTPQGVELTGAGEVFLQGALRILADVDRLAGQVQRVQRGQAGTITLAFNDIGTRCPLVPESFRTFRQRYPDAEVHLRLAKSQAQLQQLEAGTFDAGYLFDRPPHLPQFDAIPVFEDNRALILPAAHPLAAAPALRLRDLGSEDFVMTRRAQVGAPWDRIMAACRAGGLEPRIVQEMDDEHGIISLVVAGMGVAFLTESARLVLPPGVVMKRVVDLSVPMTLELVWLRSNRSVLLANFVELVRGMAIPARARQA